MESRITLSFLHAELLINLMVLIGLRSRNTATLLSQRDGGIVKLMALSTTWQEGHFRRSKDVMSSLSDSDWMRD